MKTTAAVIILMVCLALVSTRPGEAITCGDVSGSLFACLGYLQGGRGEPGGSCCGAVKSLAGRLHSRQDRQTACNCLKNAAPSFNVRPDAAARLPKKCGVSVRISVGPNTDCRKVP